MFLLEINFLYIKFRRKLTFFKFLGLYLLRADTQSIYLSIYPGYFISIPFYVFFLVFFLVSLHLNKR